jgi:hypothetical protein
LVALRIRSLGIARFGISNHTAAKPANAIAACRYQSPPPLPMQDQIFPLQMAEKALICLDPDGRTFPRTKVLG